MSNKGQKSLFPQFKTSIGHNSGSITDRAMSSAYHGVNFRYGGPNGVAAIFVT